MHSNTYKYNFKFKLSLYSSALETKLLYIESVLCEKHYCEAGT